MSQLDTLGLGGYTLGRMATTNWQRQIRQVRLIERFDAVLYPIDLFGLFDRLPSEGWIVQRSEEEERGLLVTPPVKGNVQLRVDQLNKILGISGKDIAETLSNYRAIRALSREFLRPSSMVQTDYVEFRYIGTIEGRNSPLDVFARWWAMNGRISRLGELLSERLPSDAKLMSPYGIRFAPIGLDANRPNWSELAIFPDAIAGQSRYSFDLLFRNEDSEITERVAESADEIIESTLKVLEQT